MSTQEDLFRSLLDRNYPRWRGIARCYAAPEGREDLLQEISLQVWRSLDRFAGRSSIDTWAYRIAINVALSWARSAKRRKRHHNSLPVDVANVSTSAASDKDAQHIVGEFLATLPDVDRAAMLLFLDDVPAADAAEILGLSEGALRVRMHRIRKRFEATYCEGGESK